MKNRSFFYLQYDKIDWENQEKTNLNYSVNKHLLEKIISSKNSDEIKIFDMGFGVGFFLRMAAKKLKSKYSEILLGGCEPSKKNYEYFQRKYSNLKKKVELKVYNKTFLETHSSEKFDFITSIYVFPHIMSQELEQTAKKINSLLEKNGHFILVVANEKYIQGKLTSKKDLFIEKNNIRLKNKTYEEVLHYSEIPKIGKVIDYNREEKLYLDLFSNEGFSLVKKEDLNDNGFICTIFDFEKK
jgi:tRNA1(Val) A37 N6-methylase TrmN6